MSLFGKKEPESVQVGPVQLHCEICKHELFWARDAQLHSGVATFFNVEWASPTAHCYVCAQCGYIHWFLPLRE